jgi:hypothetical protein
VGQTRGFWNAPEKRPQVSANQFIGRDLSYKFSAQRASGNFVVIPRSPADARCLDIPGETTRNLLLGLGFTE